MYLNTQTLQQATERDIREQFPNTSFPAQFIPPEGYQVLFAAPQPTHDPVIQRVQSTTPELTNLGHYEQRWIVVPKFTEYTDELDVLHTVAEQEAAAIAAHQETQAAAARETAKASRAVAVEAITVTTTAGNTFDGDEVAQGRMARAIIVLSTGFAPSITWVLADNTVIEATSAELTEALALAGAAQAAIWVI